MYIAAHSLCRCSHESFCWVVTTGMINSEEIVLPTAGSSKQNFSGYCSAKPGLNNFYYVLHQSIHALTSFSNQLLCESYTVLFILMSHMHCSHVQSCIVVERGKVQCVSTVTATEWELWIEFRHKHAHKNIHISWVMQFKHTHNSTFTANRDPVWHYLAKVRGLSQFT